MQRYNIAVGEGLFLPKLKAPNERVLTGWCKHQLATLSSEEGTATNTTKMATENFDENLFALPCQLFYWHIAEKGWRGGKNGKMYIVPYNHDHQTKLLFMPADADEFKEILRA
jgi:hypothetical protein